MGECDAGATEARTCEAGAIDRRMLLQECDKRIERGNRNLVVIAQAGVRVVHQLTESSDADSMHRFEHASILGDHVSGASIQGRGQSVDAIERGFVA